MTIGLGLMDDMDWIFATRGRVKRKWRGQTKKDSYTGTLKDTLCKLQRASTIGAEHKGGPVKVTPVLLGNVCCWQFSDLRFHQRSLAAKIHVLNLFFDASIVNIMPLNNSKISSKESFFLTKVVISFLYMGSVQDGHGICFQILDFIFFFFSQLLLSRKPTTLIINGGN